MMMRFWIPVILIVVLLTGCEEDRFPEQINSFPMEVGTEWTYERNLLVYTYESDSSEIIKNTDTIHNMIRHSVEKDTVMNDTAMLKVFVTEIEGYENKPRHYMYIDKAGLRCYAYRDPVGIIVMAKKSAPLFNPAYHSPGILGSYPAVAEAGQIVLEDPPTLHLRFPLREGTTWTYRAPEGFNRWQIDKKVTGKEAIIINGEEFLCFRISYIYMNSIFEGLELTDWIAEEGLIKREVLFPRAKLTSVDGTEENTVQIHEVITLKNAFFE